MSDKQQQRSQTRLIRFDEQTVRELMKSKTKPHLDDLVQSIGEIARAGRRLARQAEKQYAPEVEDILRTQCRDPQRIEHLLDGILDFGFDAAMVRLYKKLCRYYFEIDRRATASYVYAYRDMWDEEGQAKGEERVVK
jgi:hypothetical protein